MSRAPHKGIALITALLILLLMSTIIAGISWLVMGDQKLGGNNGDRQLAFYGAESGIEALTAQLENEFNSNYAPAAGDINGVISNTPTNLVPGVRYLAPGSTTNGSGYAIAFSPDASGNPTSSYHTISTGPYAGLVGLTTPYTLSAIAHTTQGSEVKLVRSVQTVGIPIFQFGIFSEMDLGFHSATDFDFGGRVHTNGNLWLAEGGGNALTMEGKVTASGQIITTNLMNGVNALTNYGGAINITTNPGSSSYRNLLSQTPKDSVTGSNNYIGNVSSYDSTFGPMASNIYNSNVAVGNTGVTPLNLAIATPAIGGQPIDMIRRPIHGEDTAASAKLAERYYSQVSLRILLSDYGSDGTCATSDLSSTGANALPGLATNLVNPGPTPVDLATLSWDSLAGGTNVTPPYNGAPPNGITPANLGISVFPLPVSNATGASYSNTNGYWQKQYMPIIQGCLKIEFQNTAGGTWTDVTWPVLNLGFTGRNVNPQVGQHTVPLWTAGIPLPNLAAVTQQVNPQGPVVKTGISTVGCTDPSPNAVIRLARLRDNPSSAAPANNYCGNNPSTNSWYTGAGSGNYMSSPCDAGHAANCASKVHGTDYWPNVLFDGREGLLRDADQTAWNPNSAGAMYYVEIDVANLANYFNLNSTAINHTTGFSVYFSDRRGEQLDPNPPASVGGTNVLTGGYGYEDFINSSSVSGCPNNTIDSGEDLESDFANGTSLSPTVLRTYGNVLRTTPAGLWPLKVTTSIPPYPTYTQLGTVAALETGILKNHPNCSGPGLGWPFALANNNAGQELRMNPPIFFRRALKLVDASSINTNTTCNGVSCGVTVVSENPVYIQGDWNNNPNTDATLNTPSTDTHVATSVVADAVTLLSNKWNDVNSFANPFDLNSPDMRLASPTTYRLAIVGGKGLGFQQPSGQETDMGTDGGVHNFLRYLEDWNNITSYYFGSMVSVYYSHQAYGIFKCCAGGIYNPPVRNYDFDTDFLTPSLLPPLTPMLRALNTLTFTQDMLPTQ